MMILKNKLAAWVKACARTAGLELISTREVLARTAVLERALARMVALDTRVLDSPYLCEGIVFSKDRPLQLYALLQSYYSRVKNPVPLTVMYTASDVNFATVYEQVIDDFKRRKITFVRETRFRDDLPRVLENIKAPRLFFLVDDIVFINPVDMQQFAAVDATQEIRALRLAPHIQYSYTAKAAMPVPPFTCRPDGMVEWCWGEGQQEWGYPQSVDGNLFDTKEIIAITATTLFKAPNSYEYALGQYAPVFYARKGACYAQSVLFNIPANKVQGEVANRAGDVSPAFLLQKWHEGLMIDVEALAGFANTSTHQEVPFQFVPRVKKSKGE